jgi:hypothetical protein
MTSRRFPFAVAATVAAILGVAVSPNSMLAWAQTPPPVKPASPASVPISAKRGWAA